jgi:hypothetical protein
MMATPVVVPMWTAIPWGRNDATRSAYHQSKEGQKQYDSPFHFVLSNGDPHYRHLSFIY